MASGNDQVAMAGGTARPSQYSTNHHPSPPARQGGTPYRVSSLRPSRPRPLWLFKIYSKAVVHKYGVAAVFVGRLSP
jgi:hypothetical protein